jgi:hypothetical protein
LQIIGILGKFAKNITNICCLFYLLFVQIDTIYLAALQALCANSGPKTTGGGHKCSIVSGEYWGAERLSSS